MTGFIGAHDAFKSIHRLEGTRARRVSGVICSFWLMALSVGAVENFMLTGVPDYAWHAGCFCTAAGNMMGYWDRHGFPDFYTGPTANGIAPLNNSGFNAGISSMWASKAGFDGRPADEPGHIDDYWQFYYDEIELSYESTAPDPYLTAGRAEHSADCIGDFIGSSQNKWTSLNGECDGNIDAFSFTFWDSSGDRQSNYVPPPQEGIAVRDIPSGLRAWADYRGYSADVFSQLVDFNPNVGSGHGFTFEDLKREIDSGYPVMLFLQRYTQESRFLPGMPRANPEVHGMVAFGYLVSDTGTRYVRYRTSWGGSTDNRLRPWRGDDWEAFLPVRGVIGFHPKPKISKIALENGSMVIRWDGPSSSLRNLTTGESKELHWYVVERAEATDPERFTPVGPPILQREYAVPNCCAGAAFFRVRLVPPPTA